MKKLMEELENFIKETRERNQYRPFETPYEEACKEGRCDLVDDLEILINKFK